MKQYHLAGAAIVLAFVGLGAFFGAGYTAGVFGLTATIYTEVVLIVLIAAGIGLAIAAVSTEGRERAIGSRGAIGRLRGRPRNELGKMNAGHAAWFVIGLVLVFFIAAGAASYEAYYDTASATDAAVVGFLVFLLLFVVLVVVLAAMVVDKRLKRHKQD